MMPPTVQIDRFSDRRHRIALIDGPNMSSLGRRNKDVYGTIASLADLQEFVRAFGSQLGVDVETFDSNHEGDILEFIHDAGGRVDGFLINPAGLTTKGEAVRHALQDTELPVVELHFANIRAVAGVPRGLSSGTLDSSFTHTATGMSMGLRQYSYTGGLLALVQSLDDPTFLGVDGAAE